MPKINIYVPDELAEAVKEAGVPVSAVCQRALEHAVRRLTAIRETAHSDLDDTDLAARLPQFTARASSVLRLGIEQARAAGAPAVGSGHLLGGLLAERGNLALRILQAVEIEPDRVGHELASQSSTEASIAPEDASRRFSGPASAALELAFTEATTFGHNYVGSEHLLLGLIAEPDGTAGHVLRSLGAELRLTRRAVAAALAAYTHLQAQTSHAAAAEAAPTAEAVTAAIRQELLPITHRIERLEQRLGTVAES